MDMIGWLDFSEILDITTVLTILQMIPMLVMVWIGVIAAWGLLKKKRPDPPLISKEPYRFGIIVCAHNEEGVIGSLFESVGKQKYDMEKVHVFLLADHCTDKTAEIGRKYPFVTVLERESGPTTGKGAVLHWGIPHILAADPGQQTDAYTIIDADNVLREDYLSRMDKKLREGNLIVQGNRLGGQPYKSVITKWYTMYWACYTVFFSYAREKIGLSAFLTGTGFAVQADLLRKEGWDTKTITEDVEYSIQNIIQGRRVAFCVDAVCYDEQPYQFGVMFSQLQRWCTGGYQVLGAYFRKIVSKKNKARRIQRFDVVMLLLMGPCSWISALLSWINRAIMIWNLPLFFIAPIAFASAFGTICIYIGVLATLKYNRIGRRKIGIWAVLTFPVFLWVYMVCSIKTFFAPTKKWTKIDHEALNTNQT